VRVGSTTPQNNPPFAIAVERKGLHAGVGARVYLDVSAGHLERRLGLGATASQNCQDLGSRHREESPAAGKEKKRRGGGEEAEEEEERRRDVFVTQHDPKWCA